MAKQYRYNLWKVDQGINAKPASHIDVYAESDREANEQILDFMAKYGGVYKYFQLKWRTDCLPELVEKRRVIYDR